MPTLSEALRDARSALQQALALEEREAGIEAHVLLGHALQQSRAYLIANGSDPLAPDQSETFHALLNRRLAGEPVAYILGSREFFGLTLRVTPDVLIPRPDTELLVESALACIPKTAEYAVLDLGTGSGAIALAIATQRPSARVTAVDQSSAALAVARDNAQRLRLSNIRFLQGSWFDPLDTARFGVIVSNPPYIAENDPHLLQGDLRFEPQTALTSGQDGLNDIRSIAAQARKYLLPHGHLLLEHGFEQGASCRKILQDHGFENPTSLPDLAGLERVTVARTPV